MERPNTDAGDTKWGWTCPLCETDVSVARDPGSVTFWWECDADACEAIGFGYSSRRRARLAVRDLRERYENVYR